MRSSVPKNAGCAGAIRDDDAAIALDPKLPSSCCMHGRAKAMFDDPSAAQDLKCVVAGEPGIATYYAEYGIQAR